MQGLSSSRLVKLTAFGTGVAFVLSWVMLWNAPTQKRGVRSPPKARAEEVAPVEESPRIERTRVARAPTPPKPKSETPLRRRVAVRDERAIHGMTFEERIEKGFTPLRIFASRSGARLEIFATIMERVGRSELAGSLRTLATNYRTAQAERDETKTGWDELSTNQADLISQFLEATKEDVGGSPFMTALAERAAQDAENALTGDLESIDRKIEEETKEVREKDDVNEVKGAEEEEESSEQVEDGQ